MRFRRNQERMAITATQSGSTVTRTVTRNLFPAAITLPHKVFPARSVMFSSPAPRWSCVRDRCNRNAVLRGAAQTLRPNAIPARSGPDLGPICARTGTWPSVK